MSTAIAPLRLGAGTATPLRERAATAVRTRAADLVVALTVVATVGMVSAHGMRPAQAMVTTDDEGTYVAQGWAVVKWGRLGHYTYWYDHPPLGWVQIGLWAELTDAFARRSTAVSVGREVMLLATLTSAVLLYVLARRLGTPPVFAGAVVLLFGLSPLAVYYHRLTFLDNIAVPWVLAALVLAADPRRRLAAHAGSALCFAVAVCTKETVLVLLPAVVYQLWQNGGRGARRYTFALFGSFTTLLLALYPLYAAIKNELFAGPGHVSLQYAITWQLFSRTASGSIFDRHSPAGIVFTSWVSLDPWLLGCAVAVIPVGLVVRRLRPVTVGLAVQALVVLRHGYLPDPYVVAALPFAALVVGGVLGAAWTRWGGRVSVLPRAAVLAAVVAFVLAVTPHWRPALAVELTADPTASFRQTEDWMETNIPRSATLLVSDDQWVDLVQAGFAPDHVIWYFKADLDPAVEAVIPNGWRDIDYVMVDHDMSEIARDQAGAAQIATLLAARAHGRVVASFGTGVNRITVYRVQDGTAAPAAPAGPAPRRATPAAPTAPTAPTATVPSRAAGSVPSGTGSPAPAPLPTASRYPIFPAG